MTRASSPGDIYAGRADDPCSPRVGGEGDLRRLRQACRSVFADWARGPIDVSTTCFWPRVTPRSSLTFISAQCRQAHHGLKELAAIDHRELFIGASALSR